MEQRRLRLGDILDDYCPRERRVTNHAVVAMIEEEVKQTRCTTCDSEHAYKGARVPKRRKKETPAALFEEVLAEMPDGQTPVLAATKSSAPPPDPAADDSLPEGGNDAAPDLVSPTVISPPQEDISPPMHSDDNDQRDDVPQPAARVDDAPNVDGPVHRPLIRATLPRPEGQKDARPLPEFTVRNAPRGGNGHGSFRGERVRVRGGGHNGQRGEPNGNRMPGTSRFHGNRGPASGRPGRAGSPGFRGGSNKRGRGSRG